MNSKVLVAFVSIVAVAAVGVGVFFLMNGGPVSLDVDEVRTDLRVGDYAVNRIDSDLALKDTITGCPGSDLTDQLYMGEAMGDKSVKTVNYKGQSIVCDYYEYSVETTYITCAKHPATGVTYEATITNEDGFFSYLLKDTNFDLSLKEDEQKVAAGSFVLFEYTTPYVGEYSYKGDLEYKMDEYNPKTDLGTMVTSADLGIHGLVREMITEITPSGKIITNLKNEPQSEDEFFSGFLYDSTIRWIGREGNTISYISTSEDTIDTIYGKRHVTIQTLDVHIAADDIDRRYVITYGDKGIIYSLTISYSESWVGERAHILQETSLKI